jgi:sugar lactone lactonase YvrE
MLAGDVLFLADDGTIDRRHVGNVAAVLRPRRQGGAVIGVERGFALEEADGTLTHLGELWSDTNIRMNEGGCDPDGRFYCGSMAYDQRPDAGALYRLDPDGSVHVVLENVTISNGLEWSGARGAGDSASPTELRERILRARPGRGVDEVQRGLCRQSIGRE